MKRTVNELLLDEFECVEAVKAIAQILEAPLSLRYASFHSESEKVQSKL